MCLFSFFYTELNARSELNENAKVSWSIDHFIEKDLNQRFKMLKHSL